MRRVTKFVHTLSAIGLIGGLATYTMVLAGTPEPTSLADYGALRATLAAISKWLLLPSLLVVLVSGILAMILHFPYMDAPWVWVKALSGFVLFEGTLMSVDAPAARAASASARAMAGEIDRNEMLALVDTEWGALYVLLAVGIANVALGIWRPRFGLKQD